ncbi:MAG: hypothetical protein ABWZ99_03885, partial [Ilumatobacteraceae bacterium]
MQRPPIPAFDIVDHSGRRRRVHPASVTDTVADLARALGHRDGLGTTIDGRTVAGGVPLSNVTELVEGVQVRIEDPMRPVDRDDTARDRPAGVDVGIEFAVVTGPSCRTWSPLVVGRHGLGRSPTATIRLADDLVEIHHAIVEVDPEGSIVVTQLTGRVPVLVRRSPPSAASTVPESDPTAGAGAGHGHPAGPYEQVNPGDALIIGSTRVELRTRPAAGTATNPVRGTIADIPGDPWHREV